MREPPARPIPPADLDGRILRYFLAVVREGSIRRAACTLNVAPSAVRRQISDLELRLGMPLLDRLPRGVVPTEAGAALAEHARHQMEDGDRLLDYLRQLHGLRKGAVRISCGEGFVGELMDDGVQPFSQRFPQVRLRLMLGVTPGILEAVAETATDIGLAYDPPSHPGVRSAKMARQPPCLVALGHALAAAGVHLVPHLESNSIGVVRRFAMFKGGVTLLPRFAVASEVAEGRLYAIPLSDTLLAEATAHLLVRGHTDALAELETLSAGKPIRDTRVEVAKAAEMFEYYAGWADKLQGDMIPVPTSHLNYTRPEPFGTVVQITPWNAPIFTAGWQVAPALCAGNAVVLKPSELTPLTSLVLGRLCGLAEGMPRGLVSVLAGAGPTTGAAAVSHRDTRLVVFVGSAEAGAQIAAAARTIVPSVLELGGKSGNIVFAGADLDRAVLGAQAAIFGGAGQSCVAGSRLLVQRAAHAGFVARPAAAAGHIPIGAPMDDATQIGPINNRRQWQRIEAMVHQAAAGGARIVTGGACPAALPGTGGFFFAPTILDGVTPDAAITQEEVFGPVLAVPPFDTEEEAVTLANDTPFGLAGAVWTNDVSRAHRIAAAVRAGTFRINGYKAINVASPFGGFGRSSGKDALMAYTHTKSVWV